MWFFIKKKDKISKVKLLNKQKLEINYTLLYNSLMKITTSEECDKLYQHVEKYYDILNKDTDDYLDDFDKRCEVFNNHVNYEGSFLEGLKSLFIVFCMAFTIGSQEVKSFILKKDNFKHFYQINRYMKVLGDLRLYFVLESLLVTILKSANLPTDLFKKDKFGFYIAINSDFRDMVLLLINPAGYLHDEENVTIDCRKKLLRKFIDSHFTKDVKEEDKEWFVELYGKKYSEIIEYFIRNLNYKLYH